MSGLGAGSGAVAFRHMQVDLLLDPFGARWAKVRDAASAAVDAGFAGIWTWDHLDGRVFGATHVLECWTMLTAIAVAVPDVMVGPLVLNVANRRPGVLAVMAATDSTQQTSREIRFMITILWSGVIYSTTRPSAWNLPMITLTLSPGLTSFPLLEKTIQ